jgi:hypothetical protein
MPRLLACRLLRTSLKGKVSEVVVAGLVAVAAVPGVGSWTVEAQAVEDSEAQGCAVGPAVYHGAPPLPALAATSAVVPGAVLSFPKEGDDYRVDAYPDYSRTWKVEQVWVVRDAVSYYSAGSGAYEVAESDVGVGLQVIAVVSSPENCGAVLTRLARSPSIVVEPGPRIDPAPDPAKSTVAVATVAKHVAGKASRVRVNVNLSGGTVPQGMVTVTWGSKRSQSVSVALRASNLGEVTARLPGLKAGTHKVRATFTDNTGMALDGKSKNVKLKVTKRK